MEHRTVSIPSGEIAVAEAGTGGRPLLLVHGFTGAKEDFTDFLDDLAGAGWHAVAPDTRGHGRSFQPDSEDDYDFELYADDLWALVDALGWERFALLGHSMGGMIAQVAAVRDPSRLHALILMDTSCGAPEGLDASDLELGVSVVREHGMTTLHELMSARDTEVLETPASVRVRAERPGWEEFERSKFINSSPAMWASMVRKMIEQEDRIDHLTRLPESLPVLVLVGEQDAPFIGPSQRMAKSIPGARALVMIPDAGHSPQFENTDAWWRALSSFLQEVS